jgi:hypothetical protein
MPLKPTPGLIGPRPRLSPKRVLGEGLMAAAAWQCVAACDWIAGGKFIAANVSLVGAKPTGHRRSIPSCRPERFRICRQLGESGQSCLMNPRVILITGANGGLGQAMARSFLQESPENQLWLGIHARS